MTEVRERKESNEGKRNDILLASEIEEATVFYVDDDEAMCESVRFLIESVSLNIETFSSARKFLESYEPGSGRLLVIRCPDARNEWFRAAGAVTQT